MHSSTILNKMQCILPNIQPDTIRQKLTSFGADCVYPLNRIQRYHFLIPQKDFSYIRIQQEYGKITMRYCESDQMKWEKLQVFVDNADLLQKILIKCGCMEKSIHEFYRESWRYHNVDLCIERWPWLRPFLKIRWANHALIESFLELMGCHSCNVLFDATSADVYKNELWISWLCFQNIRIISFDCPPTFENT